MQDTIALLLKDLHKLRFELRDIKKDIKNEERIENEEYLQLKKALKDLRAQVKDFEDRNKQELSALEDYQKLRELCLEKEETIAQKKEELFKVVDKLPKQFSSFEINIEEELAKVQLLPAMRMFVNGREEKQSAAASQ